MPTKLAKHGSEAGYREELKTGNVCERCRNGHRVFDTQYSRRNKDKGLKYGRYDVLDGQYKPNQPRGLQGTGQTRPEPTGQHRPRHAPEPPTEPPASTAGDSDSPDFTLSAEPTGPSLADRFGSMLGKMPRNVGNEYVEESGMPDYLHTVDPDPEPGDGSTSPIKGDEFVITQQSMILIEDNLGTYLSVVAMTLSLADPYCAPNDDEIDELVKRWSKVISRYPSAAKLFMSKGGGVIMDWIGALQATWPILYRVYEHHLSNTVKTDKGRVYRVQPSTNGQTVDATMPPMPDYDYSAT